MINNDHIGQKAIIEKAKRGDQLAMQQLYHNYAKAMLNTAYRIVNHQEEAEDILQDSFLKAFTNLQQFQFQSTFGAWLKRIVVNRSIDGLKRQKKEALFKETLLLERAETNIVISKKRYTTPNVDELYQALHQLPDGYRTIFSLYILEGYDHSEIAQILNIKESTSISQLSRAKKKLKSLTIKNWNHG